MGAKRDLTGQTFHRLTVLRESCRINGHVGWECRCSCGNTAIVVVSSSFRGLSPIMFGIVADNDQVKDNQGTQFIGKGADLVGFGAELTKKAF